MTHAVRSRATLVLLVVACGGPSPGPGPATPAATGPTADLAIVNVAVVPMDVERVLPGQTVLVRGDRIVAVGPADRTSTAGAERVVDGAGAYLVPGLADMHVHLWAEQDLPLYVANGVTLVRNMWGAPEHLAYRQRLRTEKVLAPSIVTAGPIVDGDPPYWEGSAVAATPEAGRREVAEQHAAGYDFIKVYNNLTAPTLAAIMDEARARGMPVAGHVPNAISLEDALRSGFASVEHLSGMAQAVTRPGTFTGDMAANAELARRLERGEVAFEEVYDPASLRRMAELSAEVGTWQVPTLIVLRRRRSTRPEADALLARPEVRYMPPGSIRSWHPDANARTRDVTDDDLAALQLYYDVYRARVTALHEAGARILAGSDAPNPHVLHGFSLHEELELLHEAGLSRFEALVAATRGPAEYLGATDEFGTVAAGRRADLVLVPGNPLEDLAHLQRPLGVVLRGTWYSRTELQATLEDLAAAHGAEGS